MSLHKLTAGDGYTYLTRQVAVVDSTERGSASLGEYYTEKGESPGRWMGSGLAGLDTSGAGLNAVDPGSAVSEAQMLALFGEGRHPDATAIEERLIGEGMHPSEALVQTRLGIPYAVYEGSTRFRQVVARRFVAHNVAVGRKGNTAIEDEVRARIRTEVARELFAEQYGRPAADERELSGFIARGSRQSTTAVAGYDLTFSPVKSVSTLWAVAPREVSEKIEAAHRTAVADVIGWLQTHAAYTRLGAHGVRQVETHGLMGAAFTHRDSRAGDPDLHTHVAISNKVQTTDTDGTRRWLALDGRTIHKTAVAASERYNTRLEAHLVDRLGCPSPREWVATPRSGQCGKSWESRRSCRGCGRRAAPASRYAADSSPPSFRWRTGAHPRRWNHWRWPSRPAWKPANPNTHHVRTPSNASSGATVR